MATGIRRLLTVTAYAWGMAAGVANACPQPAAPVVTTSVDGGVVTVDWNRVTGAETYRLEFSRTPGGTELQQTVPAQQTSYSQHAPFVGTFYVRVAAANRCGRATSTEQRFVIATLVSGSGPRTPNPPPGEIITRATLGYALGVIRQVAAQHPRDLERSCRDRGGNNVFLFRVVRRLREIDTRWGMNDKRGNAGDMSQDVIAYNPTERPDNGESQVYLFDIIAGHCGDGRTDVWFNDVTDVTWAQRGNPACGTTYCARWTIDQYLRSRLAADSK